MTRAARARGSSEPALDRPHPMTSSKTAGEAGATIRWADRGWWLSVDYPVLSTRGNFTRALERLRGLGAFTELLDEEGRIVHRNLFDDAALRDAWTSLALLSPWKSRLELHLKGDQIPYALVHDILWCAAFDGDARACEVRADSERWTIGCDRVLDLSPRDFDHDGTRPADAPAGKKKAKGADDRRHLMTFSELAPDGTIRFDRHAIADFVEAGERFRLCPAAPRGMLDRLLAALPPKLAPADLGWGAVLELDGSVRSRLGSALTAEHELDLLPRVECPLLGTPLVIRKRRGKSHERLRVELADGTVVSEKVIAPGALERVVADDGVVLEATVTGGFYRRMRFLLSQRSRLSPKELAAAGRPGRGYSMRLVPEATRDYGVFVRGLIAAATGATVDDEGDDEGDDR